MEEAVSWDAPVMTIAVVMNTNQLGGAERSLVEQLKIMRETRGGAFRFFIPDLGTKSNVLTDFLSSQGFSEVQRYSYPLWLYQFSRKDFYRAPVLLLLLPLLPYLILKWRLSFTHSSVFYVNGNKAFIPVFCSCLLRRRAVVYWHFRDFPAPRAFSWIKKILDLLKPRQLRIELIANSHAVDRELHRYLPGFPVRTIYNLAGTVDVSKVPGPVRRIGIASMFAPWKGQHDVLWMISSYRREIRALGIEKFTFFGDSIYQTRGGHRSYREQLQLLATKLGILDLVEFVGGQSPSQIFSAIDVLLHCSIEPEPFGRVIIEAFKARVPVISTGLGGAAELVQHQQTGLIYQPFDLPGLFGSLEQIASDPKMRERIIRAAAEKSDQIEAAIIDQLKDWRIEASV